MKTNCLVFFNSYSAVSRGREYITRKEYVCAFRASGWSFTKRGNTSGPITEPCGKALPIGMVTRVLSLHCVSVLIFYPWGTALLILVPCDNSLATYSLFILPVKLDLIHLTVFPSRPKKSRFVGMRLETLRCRERRCFNGRGKE